MDLMKNKFNVYTEILNQKSFLVLGIKEGSKIEKYSMRMLSENKNGAFLSLDMMQRDTELGINYDVTSKMKLKSIIVKISDDDFVEIMVNIIDGIKACGNLMLSPKNIALFEEYIYISTRSNEVSLMYVPLEEEIIPSAEKGIIDLILRIMDSKSNMDDILYAKLSRVLKRDGVTMKEIKDVLQQYKGKEKSERGGAESPSDMINDPLPKSQPPKGPIKPVGPIKAEIPIKQPTSISGGEEVDERVQKVQTRKPKDKKKAGKIMVIGGVVLVLLATLVFFLGGSSSSGDNSVYLIGVLVVLVLVLLLRVVNKSKKNKSSKNHKIIKKEKKSDKKISKEKKKEVKQPISYEIESHEYENNQSNNTGATACLDPNGDENTVILGEINKTRVGILVPRDKNRFADIVIDKCSMTIGSKESKLVDIIVNSPYVGRVHGDLTSKNGKYFIKDLNSKNGVFHNKERIPNEVDVELSDGDHVRIADVIYEFKIKDE